MREPWLAKSITATVPTSTVLLDITVEADTPEAAELTANEVADRMVKLRGEYAVAAVPGLSVSLGFNHTSARYADNMNTDRLPAYMLFDAGARYEWGSTRNPVVLRLNVLNLTDKHYWTNGAALGEPRTVMLSASYKF